MNKAPLVGVTPINWWPAEVPLPPRDKPTTETVLSEMVELGFAGTELPGVTQPPQGNILPRDPAELNPLLERFGLKLAGGWFQTRFLEEDFEAELERARRYARKLVEMGTSVMTGADFSFSTNDSLVANLFPSSMPILTPAQWRTLSAGWNGIALICRDMGLTAAYHPHLGSPVLEAWQIDRFFGAAPDVHMLLDTGHLAAAGVDYLAILDSYIDRIAHVHLKNIRPDVVRRVNSEPFAWQQANVAGLFTVPGYGGIEFPPILSRLGRAGYHGWIILEAEQDPHRFDPYVWAQMGREFVRQAAGW